MNGFIFFNKITSTYFQIFIKYWILVSLLFFTLVSFPQEKQYLFKTFDRENGLSNNNVLSVLRDSKGFLWLGTFNGLNRFDGYEFKTFVSTSDNSNTIGTSAIRQLSEDYDSNIWVGAGDDLNILNPRTGQVTKVDTLFNGKLPYQNETKWNLHKDIFGHYWYISSKQGVYKYIHSSDSLMEVLKATESSNPLYRHHFTGSAEDSEGNIWICDRNGNIICIDNKTTHIIDTIKINVVPDSYIKIFIDTDNDIWYYDNSYNVPGLFQIDIRNYSVRQYNVNSVPVKLSSEYINGIIEAEPGVIWVVTDQGGVNIINKHTNNVCVLNSDAFDKRSIPENTLDCIYKDNEEIIWLGTFKHGLAYYHPKLFSFEHIKIPSGNSEDVSINDIDNFAEDDQGNLWIGTNGGGLWYYNRKSNTYKQYKHDPEDPQSLSADIIIGMTFDKKGNLWLGTYMGGLVKWNGEYFKTFNRDTTKTGSITDNRIWDICEDADGLLWIATLLGGVNVFDPVKEEVTEVFRWVHDTTIRSNVVFTIIEDRRGIMWFATVDGVRSYNKRNRKFEYYENNPNDPESLSSDVVFDLFEDSRGLIWVATTKGLNILDRKTNKFKVLTEENGLTDNHVLTIQEDNSKDMWVSTTNGISRIRVSVNQNDLQYNYSIMNFDYSDGLQDIEFNEKASLKTSQGELLFGGGNGYNLIDPFKIKATGVKPNLIFTDFLVFNKSYNSQEVLNNRVLLKNDITYTKKISLNYNENLFSIKFANLNFFHPERFRYKYRMVGFNDTWLEAAEGVRSVSFTNLDPGTYTFQLQVSNNDGSWNPTVKQLQIIINPPWWLKWWFRIAVALFVLLIIGLVFYLRFHQLNVQKKQLRKMVNERTAELSELNTVLEERQEEIVMQNEQLDMHRDELSLLVEERTKDLKKALQKAEESDRLKSAFLANMSHEIRTPMNAIVGFSNLLREDDMTSEERNEHIDIINNNSESLLVLINDILDISKIEANQLSITKTEFDIIKLLIELDHTYKLNQNENLEIRYIENENFNSLIIEHDEIRIKQVLQNLINNAVKFTESGHIHFGFHFSEDKIAFYVEDTGIGIDPEEGKKIFAPFNKIEIDKNRLYGGAGLGLTICKRISELMNGQLSFESDVNKGTTFTFEIPVEVIASNLEGINSGQNHTQTIDSDENDDVHVLIAEDEVNNYKLLESILRREGIGYTWVTNGLQAVEFMENNSRSNLIILMDIKMPVMDGVEAFNRIRKINKRVPIVALTAYAYENEKLEILKNDFSDYLSKPFIPMRIIELLKKHLPGKF